MLTAFTQLLNEAEQQFVTPEYKLAESYLITCILTISLHSGET
jgi:hypothetical protein